MTDRAVRFTNPVLAGDRPDPAVIKVGDEYWLTYSSFESAPGLPLYRSTDLVNWTYEGVGPAEPLGNTFAVDIAEHDGRFFIYIPFIPTPWSTLTDASIFVIHARSMSGPWSEPIDLGIRGAIDPGTSSARTADATCSSSGVRRIELADDGLSTVGELEQVYDGWRYPDDWITEAYALEGPKLFRREGWFYLVSAVGGTGGPADRPHGDRRALAVGARPVGEPPRATRSPARGMRPSAGGRVGTPRSSGPADDDWWMVSHGYEHGFRTLGRQILLEPIAWTDDGWPVPTIGRPRRRDRGRPAAAAQHPSPEVPRRLLDAAPGGAMGVPRARRRAKRSRAHVDDGLVLAGKGTSPADTSPLAILTGDHSYEVEVDVERRARRRGAACCCSSTTASSAAWDRRRADAELLGRHPHPLARAGRRRRSHDAAHPQRRAHRHRLVPRCRAGTGCGTACATRPRATTPTRRATC